MSQLKYLFGWITVGNCIPLVALDIISQSYFVVGMVRMLARCGLGWVATTFGILIIIIILQGMTI